MDNLERNWQHWAIKNGQSREKLATLGNQEWTIQRETGNIGYTRHRTKTNKTKNTTQKTKKTGNSKFGHH